MTSILPKPYLVNPDKDIIDAFYSLSTRADVANILEVEDSFLRYILYHAKSRKHYAVGELPKKSGGKRTLLIPPKNIKILQDKLLHVISLIYKSPPYVNGFVRSRSIVDNATPHVGARYILNFDLADYFPSIHIGRIAGMLTAKPYQIGREAAVVIGQIVTHDNGLLPQGAPTSPIIANMVTRTFDAEMIKFAKKHRCKYTRYADDITLSTNKSIFPKEVAYENGQLCMIGDELLGIIKKEGFTVRDSKTRFRSKRRRQRVTGLTVNEFPNVSQKYMRQLRALIYDCNTRGATAAALHYAELHGLSGFSSPESWIYRVVVGKLAFLQMVRGDNDYLYQNLARAASLAFPSHKFEVKSAADRSQQRVRWRSSRSVDWALWVDRYKHSVYMLKVVFPDKSTASGTAFKISGNRLATAGHNVLAIGEEHVCRRLYASLDNCSVEIEKVRAFNENFGRDIAEGTSGSEYLQNIYIPTQNRIPAVGEEVIAIGYPAISNRHPDLVMHVGRVEAVLPTYARKCVFISVSFPSGPGLSGAPLIDVNGYCVGVMSENCYIDTNLQQIVKEGESSVITKTQIPYGQATWIGHLTELIKS